MSNLNSAIQLIREGQKDEARRILEPLLQAEPANIPAWFWYVDTCRTFEERIQTLELCLKKNPGNSQVMQALLALRSQRPSQTKPAPPPAQAPKPAATYYDPAPYSAAYEEPPKKSAASSTSTFDYDYGAPYSSAATESARQQTPAKKKNAWEEDLSAYVDTSMLSKPRPAAKSYAFYEVWMTALAMLDIGKYENMLNDPEAGTGRALEWISYAGIISGVITALTLPLIPQFSEITSLPEFNALYRSNSLLFIGIMTLALALLYPLVSVIGISIGAGIQNFLAVLWGGNGYYSRTLYALAAYLAPFMILSAVLGVIPVVGQCLLSFFGIYNFVLNVRALKVAHSFSTGKAVAVMFTPTLVIFIFMCLFLVVIGFSGGSR
jgi:hypothetical protein